MTKYVIEKVLDLLAFCIIGSAVLTVLGFILAFFISEPRLLLVIGAIALFAWATIRVTENMDN